MIGRETADPKIKETREPALLCRVGFVFLRKKEKKQRDEYRIGIDKTSGYLI